MLNSIVRFISAGGIFMIPLAACSILSVTMILERAFALRRRRVIKESLAQAITRLRHGEPTTPIHTLSADEQTVLDRLAQFALFHAPWTKQENAAVLETKARSEVNRLERGLVVLEIMVGLGPLLGLLGTVSGLITIFGNVSQSGAMAAQGATIARGIAEAMSCTVAGLIVAIPSLIAFSLFSRHLEGFAVELESLSMDLLGKIYSEKEAAASLQS